MTQTSISPYQNNNLFSKYYLDKRLATNPEWSQKDHIEAFEKIKKIYSDELPRLKSFKESQLRDKFFNRIFPVLHFEYEVEETVKGKDRPDYAFFSDRESYENAHVGKSQGHSLYVNAIAIGEVKQWEIDLDVYGNDEFNRSKNPALQIWLYLEDTGTRWGILSNGRIWRIYCKQKEKHREDYYEIDLPSLIASNDAEAFRFFYYFFRKEAFVSSKDGAAFLDRILKGSVE